MVRNGVGGANTQTGIRFEERVDLITRLAEIEGYHCQINENTKGISKWYDIYYHNNFVASAFKKHALYVYLELNGVDYKTIGILHKLLKVVKEFYRVLKKDKFCAILIGDTRRDKMYQPLAFNVMERFLKISFFLKEDIIKHQHNCKATGFWVNKSKEYNFLLIMHEHLFIFKKVK